MEVFTTQPGIQLYTSNYLDGTLNGKHGVHYKQYSAFALETQHFPDSPNHPAFPGVIKRMLIQKDGAWSVQEEGHSYASDAAQPAFLVWLEQFKELDRRMKDDIARQQSASPTSSN